MVMSMLMTLQVAGPALPGNASGSREQPCAPGQGGEVVVCGRRQDQERYRLRPLPPRYQDDPRDAVRFNLPGGAVVAPEAQQGRLGDPQARVTLKVPL